MKKISIVLFFLFYLFTNLRAQQKQEYNYRILDQFTNDILFDSLVTKKIIVSIPKEDLSHPNSIGFIDPDSVPLSQYYTLGSEPGPISLTYNSKYLFVGLKDSPTVKRFDIDSRSINQSISIGATYMGPMSSRNIKCLPESDSVIVVGRKTFGNGQSLAVYRNGLQLKDTTAFQSITTFHFYNPYILYGYSHQATDFTFFTLAVDNNGIRLISDIEGIWEGFYDFTIYKNQALGGYGTLLDLSIAPPLSLGNTTPLITQTSWSSNWFASCYDPYENLWCVASKESTGDSLYVVRYDPNTLLRKDIIRIGNLNKEVGNEVIKIICWGDFTKLAITTGKGQLVIINGLKKDEPPTGVAVTNGHNRNVSLFPNPTTSKVVFEYPESLNIEIYNNLGERIMYKPNVNEISIQALPNSIYTVRLFDNSGNVIAIQKLVKTEL